jgi:DNA-binding beta-propeller fold protein YncE
VIGKLYLDKKVKEIDVFDLMKNGNKQIFDLNLHPIDIVGLPDNQIVCVSYDDIVVYDQNFNLMKNIKSLNDQRLDPIGIALNKDDEQLYIVENTKHRIILTDLDFNFIKYFGSRGKGNHELFNPRGICFKNHSMYVCDMSNSRVQIFNKEFELISTPKTNYGPWKIKVSNLLICVKHIMGKIYFYNLNDLSYHRE